MSLGFWNLFPDRHLKMSYSTWRRLDHGVKELLVELAREQGFKCAFCPRTTHLIVEHDHDPDHERGDRYTVFNVRGLACKRCNTHISIFEKAEQGEGWGFGYAHSRLSSDEYHSYMSRYVSRVAPLIEALMKKKLGSRIYWRRRNALSKFDDWRVWGLQRSWRKNIDEVKRRKRSIIRTPEQGLKVLASLVDYVKRQMEADPSYEPPDEFIRLIVRAKPFVDGLVQTVEEHFQMKISEVVEQSLKNKAAQKATE